MEVSYSIGLKMDGHELEVDLCPVEAGLIPDGCDVLLARLYADRFGWRLRQELIPAPAKGDAPPEGEDLTDISGPGSWKPNVLQDDTSADPDRVWLPRV